MTPAVLRQGLRLDEHSVTRSVQADSLSSALSRSATSSCSAASATSCTAAQAALTTLFPGIVRLSLLPVLAKLPGPSPFLKEIELALDIVQLCPATTQASRSRIGRTGLRTQRQIPRLQVVNLAALLAGPHTWPPSMMERSASGSTSTPARFVFSELRGAPSPGVLEESAWGRSHAHPGLRRPLPSLSRICSTLSRKRAGPVPRATTGTPALDRRSSMCSCLHVGFIKASRCTLPTVISTPGTRTGAFPTAAAAA